MVKYAREHGSYTDHTGNLRNSIGYVVVQYGRIIAESFKYNRRVRPGGNPKGDKGADEAHAKGLEHARSVAREITAKKKKLEYYINVEELDKIDAVTKAHIALDAVNNPKNREKLLSEFGHIPSKGEFIETIMNENCPAYVKKKSVTPKEAAEKLRAA